MYTVLSKTITAKNGQQNILTWSYCEASDDVKIKLGMYFWYFREEIK